MYCGKCGANNSDGAAFCKECGAQLDTIKAGTESTASTASTSVQNSARNKKVGIIAVAAIAVVAVVIIVIAASSIFGGRSYKSTVNKFMDATFNADAEAIFDLVPDAVIDYMMEEEGYDRDEYDDLIEELNDELEYQIDSYGGFLGSDLKLSHKIIGADDMSSSELRELQEYYEEVDLEISAAKYVEVELTVKISFYEDSYTQEIPVVKIGRSWYIDVFSMGGLLY